MQFDFSNLRIISESPTLPTEENIFQKMLREFLEDYEKTKIYQGINNITRKG